MTHSCIPPGRPTFGCQELCDLLPNARVGTCPWFGLHCPSGCPGETRRVEHHKTGAVCCEKFYNIWRMSRIVKIQRWIIEDIWYMMIYEDIRITSKPFETSHQEYLKLYLAPKGPLICSKERRKTHWNPPFLNSQLSAKSHGPTGLKAIMVLRRFTALGTHLPLTTIRVEHRSIAIRAQILEDLGRSFWHGSACASHSSSSCW